MLFAQVRAGLDRAFRRAGGQFGHRRHALAEGGAFLARNVFFALFVAEDPVGVGLFGQACIRAGGGLLTGLRAGLRLGISGV